MLNILLYMCSAQCYITNSRPLLLPALAYKILTRRRRVVVHLSLDSYYCRLTYYIFTHTHTHQNIILHISHLASFFSHRAAKILASQILFAGVLSGALIRMFCKNIIQFIYIHTYIYVVFCCDSKKCSSSVFALTANCERAPHTCASKWFHLDNVLFATHHACTRSV